VTDVGAPLFVNVAVMSGTVLGVGVEFQLLPWNHSLETGAPLPIQVPSVACAAFGANIASAPSQMLPSSAARLRAAGGDVVAIRIAPPRIAPRGAAARVACERRRYERIPQPLRAAPAALPHHRPRRPARTNNRPAANATGGTGNDQIALKRLGADCRRLWLSRHAGSMTPVDESLSLRDLCPRSRRHPSRRKIAMRQRPRRLFPLPASRGEGTSRFRGALDQRFIICTRDRFAFMIVKLII